MSNLVSVLRKQAKKNPDRLACLFLEDGIQESGHISYRELDERARAIAAYLQRNAIFGKRVLLLYPAGLDFITAFIACLYAGAVAVPIASPRLAEFEKSRALLNAIAQDADIAGILTTQTLIKKLEENFSEFLTAEKLFITDTTQIDYSHCEKYELPTIDDETLAYLQYTSGSTSLPKGAIVRHKNLTHSLKYTAKAWHYSKNSVTLSWAPHSHVYGLICGILVPLYQGTKTILMPTEAFIKRPLSWLDAITRYGVTHSGCPNFGYDLCIQEIDATELSQLNLSSWKVAVNGGEAVQYDTYKKFTEKFGSCGFKPNQFCPAYGMSEVTGAIAVNPYGTKPTYLNLSLESLKTHVVDLKDITESQRTIVSCGRLLSGLQAIIVDPDTLDVVGKGKIGEIWLAGKSVVEGYWHREDQNYEVFRTVKGYKEKFFRTGDLGFMHKKDVVITGRLKELIVVHGKKYYPLDLEKTVAHTLKNDLIGQARAAFCVETMENEAVIFLQEVNAELPLELQTDVIRQIRQVITEHFGIHLDDIILVKLNSLPKTPSGKLQRKLCQRLYIENKLDRIKMPVKKMAEIIENSNSATGNKITKDNLIKIIISVLHIDANEISLSDPLSDYGFDSISITKLIHILNQTYQLDLTPATLFEYPTLEKFLDYLNEKNTQQSAYTSDDTKISESRNKSDKAIPLKPNASKTTDIAIIGMSCVFPGANDPDMFWENLVHGKDQVTEIPRSRYAEGLIFDNDKTGINWGGFVEDIGCFDANFFNISPREAELTDPQQRQFLQVAWKAIEDAGYSTATLSQMKTGLFVGVFNNDYAELLHKENITDAYVTTGVTHSILANRVSYLLNLHGPSEAIDTACSSSLVAIHSAVNAIHHGDCEIAIVGGANALLSPASYLTANNAGMLSSDGHCKTFDKEANGYVRGEGFVAIVLKPLDRAMTEGDHIYGVIKGTAVNHGGHVSSLTVPNPNAQAEVIVEAFHRAQIQFNSISYIETHGTGTAIGDPIEVNGLKKAFNILCEGRIAEAQHYCGLGSVKTNIGHLESAAGLAGLIKVLLAMKYKKIPASLHFKELNPYIKLEDSPFYIVDKLQPWNRIQDESGNELPLRAGVSSFGFGGTNAHVVLEEAPVYISNQLTSDDTLPILISLSAKTEVALQRRIQDLHTWLLNQEEVPSLSALSYTLNLGRDHLKKRCVFMVHSVKELQETLNQIQQEMKPSNFIINYKESDVIVRARPIFDELFKSITKEISSNISISPTEYQNKLLALGNFYTEGYELDWEMLHRGERKRISLPTYFFAKEYFWVPKNNRVANANEEKNIPIKTEIELYPKQLNLLSRIHQDFIKHVSELAKIKIQDVNLTVSLSEMGFDSITFKELALRLEKTYGFELNPTLFFTYNTIEALSHHFLEKYADAMKQIYKISSQPFSGEKNAEPIVEIVGKNNSLASQESEPIAIIGMQGYFPQSKDLNAFWQHLEAGDDLVSEIPLERWDWHQYYGDAKTDPTKTNSKWGACLADFDKFDASFFNISAREANLMDPQHRLFMEVVWHAIEDAGYDPYSFSNQNIGLFAGVEFSEYQTLIHSQKKLFHGHIATGNSHSLLANRISYFLNLHGPSEVVDTACSSSLVAVHRAVKALQNGECAMAIAGGVSLMLDPETFIITSQLGALSADGRCKTFDKSANGYVKGEGIAAVLLKPLSKALSAGDHVYGVIKGTAVNHGGKAQSLTAPNAESQSQLLIEAYRKADINPSSITYIEAHGTGTELGDPIEIEGLKRAFVDLLKQDKFQTPFCGLGSVKTNMGHLEPASGLAGMIKVLLAMQHGKLPGNLHFKEINPYIDLNASPFYIVEKTQPWARLKAEDGMDIPRRAGVSSFGFGGTCAHVVLEEPILQNKMINSQQKLCYLFTLSAKKEQSLKQKIADMHDWLKQNLHIVDIESLSFTLNAGKAHFNSRCAIVAISLDELLSTLQMIMTGSVPNNCIFSSDQTNEITSPVMSEIYHSSIENIKNYADLSPQAYREKLLVIADLYTKHYPINWNTLHSNEKHQRIAALPAYPFVKQRYWFDAELQDVNVQTQKTIAAPVTNNISISPVVDLQNFTLNYLQSIFAEKLKVSSESIDVDTTYEVYGVDSLIGLEITNRLEQDFGVLPKTLLYERSQLSDLAKYFQQKFNKKLMALQSNNLSQDQAIETIQLNDTPKAQTETIKAINNTVMSSDPMEDIAIIGLNGIFPMANDLDEFWENLLQGRDCISEVPSERWNYRDYPVMVGGEEKYFKHGGFIPDIDKFDPLFFGIAPRDANLMDPQERLFLQSTWAMLEDAGYTREKLRNQVNNDVGVFAGVTYNFYPLFIAEEWAKGNRLPLDIQLFSIANRVSYFLNLTGPSYIVDTACSSSLAAIHLACESLRRGECKMAIAGGVNLTLHPSKYHFLGSYSFMSDQGRCASFAEGGSGYVPSEGVGAVLLKPLSLAIHDKDRIYGVIKSSSMNHGGKTSGYTVPNPNAQADVIKSALVRGNIDPRSISYIEAHGTGTALGDPIEVRGLQEAFEEFTSDKQFCAIGSVKSNIGHLESAAGISQLTKVLLQFRHKKIVPSIHAEKLNPFIDFPQTPFYVQKDLVDWNPTAGYPRRAGISSFGAGGANVHIIVEEYIQSPTNVVKKPFIFLLSAMNADRLQAHIQQMLAYLEREEKNYSSADEMEIWLSNVCYTLQAGRESMSARLATIALDNVELIKKLKSYLEQPDKAIQQMWINHTTTAVQIKKEELNQWIQQSEYAKLAEGWVRGAKIDWEKIYEDKRPDTVYVPTYPFAKRRCWVTPQIVPVAESLTQLKSEDQPPEIIKKTQTDLPIAIDTWLSYTSWAVTKNIPDVIQKPNSQDRWLIFSDKEIGFLLQDELEKNACIYCFSQTEFKQHDKNVFYINPDHFEDYYKLFLQIYEDNNASLKGIIYLWNLDHKDNETVSRLNHLVHALMQQKWQNQLELGFAARINQPVMEHDTIQYWQHSLQSLNQLPTEEQRQKILLLDLDEKISLRDGAKIILKEFQAFKNDENYIAYQNNQRYVRHFHYKLSTPSKQTMLQSEPIASPLNRDYVSALVLNSLAKLLDLAVTEIDPEVPFQNYGLDSIIGINFVAEINEHYPDKLSPMDLYRYPAVNLLVNYLVASSEPEEVEEKLTEKVEDKIDNEEQFLKEIAHLSDDEVNKLLEKELSDLDEIV